MPMNLRIIGGKVLPNHILPVNDRLFILHLNTLMRSILYHLMVNALPYLANHTLSLRYNVIKTDYD